MADCVRWCLLMSVFFNFCAVYGLKEFFCKDPDTDTLHPINTTWSSTTFCGNYTCRLRKRSLISDRSVNNSYADNPIVVDAISNDEDFFENPKETTTTTKNREEEMTNKDRAEVTTIGTQSEHLTEPMKIIVENLNNYPNVSNVSEGSEKLASLMDKNVNDKDRFLTEEEIKSITDLLYTIKKGDIDAVIDVYNLAQDIYKEMESNTVVNQPTVDNIQTTGNINAGRRKNVDVDNVGETFKKNSYWYDPTIQDNIELDVQTSPSITVPSYIAGYPLYPSPYSVAKYHAIPNYYPMHSHTTYIPDVEIMKPRINMNSGVPCHWGQKILKKQYTINPHQRLESAAKLMPLPFTYPDNINSLVSPINLSVRTPSHHAENMLSSSGVEGFLSDTVNPIPSTTLPPIQEPSDKNEKKHEKRKSKQAKNLLTDVEDKLASWQTLPLSQQILEEVKANILDSSEGFLKPFNLKKKIRLERVAKVLKFDKSRDKREIFEMTRGNVLEANDFEVYLDKITCQLETKPGLFSLGDPTKSYPYCCPHKLPSTETSVADHETTTITGFYDNTLSSIEDTTNTPNLLISV